MRWRAWGLWHLPSKRWLYQTTRSTYRINTTSRNCLNLLMRARLARKILRARQLRFLAICVVCPYDRLVFKGTMPRKGTMVPILEIALLIRFGIQRLFGQRILPELLRIRFGLSKKFRHNLARIFQSYFSCPSKSLSACS